MKNNYVIYPWNAKPENIPSIAIPAKPAIPESSESYTSYKERINAKPESFKSSKDFIESGAFIL